MKIFFRKQIILSIICIIGVYIASAQDIDVDKKSGLVTVDGKESFVLKSKNKSFLASDFSLQNTNGEELAYLKVGQGTKYNASINGYQNTQIYTVTFINTSNQCEINEFSSFSAIKSLAKTIASANLIENNIISPQAERKFIMMHNGTFFVNPNAEKKQEPNIVVNVNTEKINDNPKTNNSTILLKNDKVYRDDEMVATYKTSKSDNKTVLIIYNAQNELVCTATHINNDNENWNLDINGKQKNLLYNAQNPLEKLFVYLLDKKIL